MKDIIGPRRLIPGVKCTIMKTKFKFILLLSVLLIAGCTFNNASLERKNVNSTDTVLMDWLIEKVSVSDVDSYFNQSPGSAISSNWEQFKLNLLDGDELWLFRSRPETWAALAGAEGYVIIRLGKPFKAIITKLN